VVLQEIRGADVVGIADRPSGGLYIELAAACFKLHVSQWRMWFLVRSLALQGGIARMTGMTLLVPGGGK
jgi:hypothetical protein